MRSECVFVDLMKMPSIFFKGIVRRQIHAPTKPEDIFLVGTARRLCNKQAHIHVHGRDVGVARVQDHGHAHRLPATSSNLWAVCGG